MEEISIHKLVRQVEELKDANRKLKAALYDASIISHTIAVKFGDIEHRGSFDNCPAPACYQARVALGREGVLHD